MPPEAVSPSSGRARRRVALFAALVTIILGGGAGAWLVHVYKARVEESARRDALVIGTSLARGLAQQFEKAARFGIALTLLPGVDDYLTQTLTGTPGIVAITLRDGDGKVIRRAGGGRAGTDSTSAPVLADGIPVASVEVATDPAVLSDAFTDFGIKTAVSVLLCALAAGGLAAAVAGVPLERSRQHLKARLSRSLTDGAPEPAPAPREEGLIRAGAVGRAFRAEARRARRLAERRAAFEAYAEELLAVDFDGALRPEVAHIRAEVLGPAGGEAGDGRDAGPDGRREGAG